MAIWGKTSLKGTPNGHDRQISIFSQVEHKDALAWEVVLHVFEGWNDIVILAKSLKLCLEGKKDAPTLVIDSLCALFGSFVDVGGS